MGTQSSNIFDHDVLKLFQQISRIPRDSGNEKAISDWIRDWAQERSIEVEQDDIWDLILRKPASAGYEDHAPLLLQAHIDMVCEKDSSSNHDFAKDPIELKLDGDWIVSASGTTLGADDGIGVAAALAVLDDDTLPHPPLEVVFTVQEETTFAGAETVDISGCKAKRMINLDHADERELIVGSCGGTGVEFTMPLQREAEVPAGNQGFRIHLTGLTGGHSGEDIHRGRGNAISLLLRLMEDPRLQTVSISGGTNRLAIPREAEAIVLADSDETLRACAAEYKAAAYRLYPNGIVQMNGSFEGLVESSDNIGIISTENDTLTLTSEVRGAYQSTVDDIVKSIEALAAMTGARVSYFNGYVPWEYAADSQLRAIATETFAEMNEGAQMKQIALHAGLECGFFAEKQPGIDLISIGPDCQFFHSPKERVSASSVMRFYEFLKAILRKC